MLDFIKLARYGLMFATCGLAFTAPIAMGDDSLDQQRKDFVAAEHAWELSDKTAFRVLAEKLRDYPLYPYLAHREMRERLPMANGAEVMQFLSTLAHFPLAARLRSDWLDELAKQQQWQELVNFYQTNPDARSQCQYRTALINIGKREQALQDVEGLWLVGRAQPTACDVIFSLWRSSGSLTDKLAWQRIALAMKTGNIELARQIANYLPADQHAWLNTWVEAYKNPISILASTNSHFTTHPFGAEILSQAMLTISRQNPDKGAAVWEVIHERYRFSREQQIAIRRALGLAHAVDYRQEAQTWLAAIDPQEEDVKTREWRIRVALREQDWPSVLLWLDWLSIEEQQSPRWQYWRARTMEKMGFHREAKAAYTKAASVRDYYGFLAADKLQQPYAMQNRPLTFTPKELQATADIPGMRRAQELFFFGRLVDARREWEFLRPQLSPKQLLQTAKLASNWGWHSQAINAAFRGNYMDDVALRFPLAYRDAITAEAKVQALEPEWVYGVVRQESAFVADARSPVGALGLMQLMPDTGKQVARLINASLQGANHILDEDINIKLGAAYLRTMRDQLGNNTILATAAYNAGRNKVIKWLPPQPMAADIWVETIPYEETRDYVQRVMAYTVIYQQRLGNKALLQSFMKPVSPKITAPIAQGGPKIAVR